MENKVIHDKERHQFIITIDHMDSYLSYVPEDGNVLDFNHTFVPVELRGEGIAAKLVEAGLKYAAENNFKIIPSCSYVNVYIQRNKKYKGLLEEE